MKEWGSDGALRIIATDSIDQNALDQLRYGLGVRNLSHHVGPALIEFCKIHTEMRLIAFLDRMDFQERLENNL